MPLYIPRERDTSFNTTAPALRLEAPGKTDAAMDKPWHKYTSLRQRQQCLWTAKASATPGLPSWAAGSGSGSCTFTFRDLVHPEAADKRFRVLISQANRVLWGVRWYQRRQGLRWVRALEYQKRDVIHYHALLAGVQDSDPCTCNGAITSVRRRTSEREWRVVFHMNGFFGFHRISGEPNKRTDTLLEITPLFPAEYPFVKFHRLTKSSIKTSNRLFLT